MGRPDDRRPSGAQKSTLLFGGCHGLLILPDLDDRGGKTGPRQILLANCIVLALCLAVVAIVVVLAWA